MKILIFDMYFFNMDTSLIIALICLRILCIFLRYIWREGCLKFLIQALVFVLLCVEDENFKYIQTITKVTRFLS